VPRPTREDPIPKGYDCDCRVGPSPAERITTTVRARGMHEQLHATPVKGQVTTDGDLSEWDRPVGRRLGNGLLEPPLSRRKIPGGDGA